MPDEKKRVAVIGGGIAGLYVAYQVLQGSGSERELDLFESDARLGGRILSQKIPGIPFRAELGAMRFHSRHKLLSSLIDHLELETRNFDVNNPRLYVRGRHVTLQEIKSGHCKWCKAGSPFNLAPEERSVFPGELVRNTIVRFLKELSFPDLNFSEARDLKEAIEEEEGDCVPRLWETVREHGRYHGIPLYSVGFWNLLQHYLSNEAYQLIDITLGLDSVLGNWSVAEAIPWFLSDFGQVEFQMIPGGMERLVERLAERIRKLRPDCIHTETKVSSILRCERGWLVQLEGNDKPEEPVYDEVVLALPRRPAERLQVQGLSDRWPPAWLKSVRPHCLFKMFLLYESAWWMGEEELGAETGRIFTDLPLRQIYYFSPKWMRARGEEGDAWRIEGTEGWALLMASYSDENSVSFWHSSDVQGSDDEQELHYGPIYCRPPAEISEKARKRLRDELDSIPLRCRVRERTVRKIQKQLAEIHRGGVPEPIFGVFKDWNDDPFGAGWHTWEIGTKPWSLGERTKVGPGLYLCGEAYSDEQGWIEGALQSARSVLECLDLKNGSEESYRR